MAAVLKWAHGICRENFAIILHFDKPLVQVQVGLRVFLSNTFSYPHHPPTTHPPGESRESAVRASYRKQKLLVYVS